MADHWNLMNLSLRDVLHQYGYTYREAVSPHAHARSYDILDKDGEVLMTGRVWKIWSWLGDEIGL